jgi:holliday junction DNA helicase RuvA
MIGFLSGQVIHSNLHTIILNVNGVGYQIDLIHPLSVGKKTIDLFIYTHVREEEISLFGFKTKAELNLFKNLISVSGVGPRIGLSILATGTDKDIMAAVQDSSVDFFSAVPGIGKKTAQKLIIDLKSKLDNSTIDMSTLTQDSSLVDGLTGLGFARKEIQRIIPKMKPDLELGEQIKEALKLLNT